MCEPNNSEFRKHLYGKGKLVNTLWKREDYLILPEGELKKRLGELDKWLEDTMIIAEEYDKQHDSIWGNRLMRCRYVLGVD